MRDELGSEGRVGWCCSGVRIGRPHLRWSSACRPGPTPDGPPTAPSWSGAHRILEGKFAGDLEARLGAVMGSLGGGWRTEFPKGGIRLGESAGVGCFYLSASDQFLSLLLLLLQVAVVPGPAARSGCQRWTWHSRSLRPHLRHSSRLLVRCPLAASAAPCFCHASCSVFLIGEVGVVSVKPIRAA
jgi:hypothetical protein